MIADSVVLIALHFVERGMKAERKLRALEAEHAQQHHESDKAADRAQQGAARQAQQNKNKKNKSGGNTRNYTLNQPAKRD
jgi:hypothetical protein